jgi:chorismate mutase
MKLSQKIIPIIIFTALSLLCKNAVAQQSAQSLADSLPVFRAQIDSLDSQIIALLGQRMKVVDEVGKYKARLNIPVLQQKRFDAILQKNIALGKNVQLSETFVTELMHAIHKESLSKENVLQPAAQ